MLGALISPVVLSVSVTLVSWVTVLTAMMSMSVKWVSTIVMLMPSVKTSGVRSLADVVLVSPDSLTLRATERFAKMSTNVRLVSITATLMLLAQTPLEALLVHATKDTLVMVWTAQISMSVLRELILVERTLSVPTMMVAFHVLVLLDFSRNKESVSISMSASQTRTTVTQRLFAPTMQVVSIALVNKVMPEMVFHAKMSTSAPITRVVITPAVLTMMVDSNVFAMLVTSKRMASVLMSMNV